MRASENKTHEALPVSSPRPPVPLPVFLGAGGHPTANLLVMKQALWVEVEGEDLLHDIDGVISEFNSRASIHDMDRDPHPPHQPVSLATVPFGEESSFAANVMTSFLIPG